MDNVKILIIEDEKEPNQPLAELIEANNFLAVQCYDGESGLVKTSSQQCSRICSYQARPKSL